LNQGENALEKLTSLACTVSNSAVNEWKSKGKLIMGYICSYIPEEIFHAAGILPYRIGARGCRETTSADAVMAPITCSFARCCLELALRGEYNFLDGLVFMNACDGMRRMCDNWVHKIDVGFSCAISVPQKTDQDAIAWYKQELYTLKDKLQEFSGVSITDESLRNSIQICNQTRRLLKRLYELRQRQNPPLTGAETQDIVIMANAMPKEDYNSLLEESIGQAGERKGSTGHKARLMIVGNMLDDSSYTKFIEEAGGLVVTDFSCFGTLSFWRPVNSTEEPMDGLASAYLDRVTCPRMPCKQAAMRDLMKEMVETFQVDGIIFERMMYCNLWSGETMALEKIATEMKIPLLVLDREYIAAGLGQLRTRIQAFLEMIEGGKR
jgi:benzoyl-CoA reductase/2-hydroxyglutaryl-CoA dehydratase subunit BcrC/BadD/HgdB